MASRSAGLVGMPNVGKSTLFNALVRAQVAQASNYPFCTIDPQTAKVTVPDFRLDKLADLSKSQRKIGTQLAFTDIAGLIEGASKGAGLGNAFLGNIRSVQSILQVVRCFENADIIHVNTGPIDPIKDIKIIETELILADAQSAEKRVGKEGRVKGASKAAQAEAEAQARLLSEVRPLLESGYPARLYTPHVASHDRLAWERLQLITQKPMTYVCNVGEEHAASGNPLTAAVREWLGEEGGRHVRALPPPTSAAPPAAPPAGAPPALIPAQDTQASMAIVCAKLEAETSVLPDDERAEYLSAYGLQCSGLDFLLEESARLLQVHTFYTTGPQESRAWSIPRGACASAAAGAIHSDMERGFIRAEVCPYEGYVAAGGEAGARAQGIVRAEGKDYIMQDGDVVCIFKFQANQGK